MACLPCSGWNDWSLDVADNFRGADHTAEHVMVWFIRWNQFRDRHSPFGYNDRLALPANPFHYAQAMRFEFRCRHRLHSDLLPSYV
jgi:hypothetical protein